jgi:MFS family permease
MSRGYHAAMSLDLTGRFGRATGVLRRLDRAVAILAAIAFVSQVGVAVMLPLLPLYAIQLGASPTILGLLVSGFAVANAGGQFAAGFLVEKFGSRRLIPAGSAVYAGANLLIATATAAVPLIAYRAVAGLGGGISLVAERIYLVAIIPGADLAFANGVLSAAGSAGTVFGPAVGGLVAAVSDLRIPFLIVAVTSGVATLLAVRFLPPGERAARAPVRGPTDAQAQTPAEAPARASTRSVPSGRESPASSSAPAADGATWSRPILALLVANLGLNAAFGSFITTYAPLATTELAFSIAEVGILWSLFGVGDIVIGPWLAHIGDRTGRRRMAILASLPILVFTAAFVAELPRPLLFASAIVAGGGLAAFSACWYALLAVAAPPARQARVIATVMALSNLGIVVGATVAAGVWDAASLRTAAAVPALATVAAALGLLFVPPDRPDREAEASAEPFEPAPV